MKTKSAKGVSMNGGNGHAGGAAPPGAMADAGGVGLSMKMPNDLSVGLPDPKERGMPGVSKAARAAAWRRAAWTRASARDGRVIEVVESEPGVLEVKPG